MTNYRGKMKKRNLKNSRKPELFSRTRRQFACLNGELVIMLLSAFGDIVSFCSLSGDARCEDIALIKFSYNSLSNGYQNFSLTTSSKSIPKRCTSSKFNKNFLTLTEKSWINNSALNDKKTFIKQDLESLKD